MDFAATSRIGGGGEFVSLIFVPSAHSFA